MNVFEMIAEQQEKLKDTEPAWMVGEQLKDICRADPSCEQILAEDLQSEDMSIQKAATEIKKYADKNKGSAQCFCVTPKVADEILRKFYGLPEMTDKQSEKGSADSGSVMDFLQNFL